MQTKANKTEQAQKIFRLKVFALLVYTVSRN